MIRRELIGSNLKIDQTKGCSFNIDAVLLAKFFNFSYKVKTILDVGTGNGVLLLYASQLSKAKLIGVEIQEDRYELACHNMKLNQLEDRSEIILKDYLDTNFKNLDCIISNPPFFNTKEDGQMSSLSSDQLARHEVSLKLNDFIKKVSEQLKYGGYFYMVHRADRISEIIKLLNQHQLVVKRLKFIHPYIDKPANHVLIQCIKNGSESVVLEPPLIIYQDKHVFTKEYIKYIGG